MVSDEELLELCIDAVGLASDVAMGFFRTSDLAVRVKTTAADVVTDADLASERTIREHVLAARPTDGFVGEEGTSIEGTSGVSWVLDPIDSTANFARGIPIWSISLAAVVDNDVRAAIVACPPLSEVFTASERSGVRRNSVAVARPPSQSLAGAMLGIGWGSRTTGGRHGLVADRVIPIVGKIRSPGSPALGLAWTAIGRFDAAYYEMDFKDWDVFAGSFLCRQAGLRVEQVPPSEKGASPRLLAAPMHLWEDLADAVFPDLKVKER